MGQLEQNCGECGESSKETSLGNQQQKQDEEKRGGLIDRDSHQAGRGLMFGAKNRRLCRASVGWFEL
jgi:hypothetical protein